MVLGYDASGDGEVGDAGVVGEAVVYGCSGDSVAACAG